MTPEERIEFLEARLHKAEVEKAAAEGKLANIIGECAGCRSTYEAEAERLQARGRRAVEDRISSLASKLDKINQDCLHSNLRAVAMEGELGGLKATHGRELDSAITELELLSDERIISLQSRIDEKLVEKSVAENLLSSLQGERRGLQEAHRRDMENARDRMRRMVEDKTAKLERRLDRLQTEKLDLDHRLASGEGSRDAFLQGLSAEMEFLVAKEKSLGEEKIATLSAKVDHEERARFAAEQRLARLEGEENALKIMHKVRLEEMIRAEKRIADEAASALLQRLQFAEQLKEEADAKTTALEEQLQQLMQTYQAELQDYQEEQRRLSEERVADFKKNLHRLQQEKKEADERIAKLEIEKDGANSALREGAVSPHSSRFDGGRDLDNSSKSWTSRVDGLGEVHHVNVSRLHGSGSSSAGSRPAQQSEGPDPRWWWSPISSPVSRPESHPRDSARTVDGSQRSVWSRPDALQATDLDNSIRSVGSRSPLPSGLSSRRLSENRSENGGFDSARRTRTKVCPLPIAVTPGARNRVLTESAMAVFAKRLERAEQEKAAARLRIHRMSGQKDEELSPDDPCPAALDSPDAVVARLAKKLERAVEERTRILGEPSGTEFEFMGDVGAPATQKPMFERSPSGAISPHPRSLPRSYSAAPTV